MNLKWLGENFPATFDAKSADLTGLKMRRITRGASFDHLVARPAGHESGRGAVAPPALPTESIAHLDVAGTAALRDFNPVFVALGSVATDRLLGTIVACPLSSDRYQICAMRRNVVVP